MEEEVVEVKIDQEEYWPVYEVTPPDSCCGRTVSIPKSLYEENRRVIAEWLEVQEQLEGYWEEARDRG